MIRYAHTNLIARDVPLLIAFYRDVLGCRSIDQTRDLSGEWVDRLTGLSGAHIFGEHLALPGYDAGGPTLEIFGTTPWCRIAPSASTRADLHISRFRWTMSRRR